MEQKEILVLLDKLDKFRRAHQDKWNSPPDWCMRAMEAIVAEAGGFESRNDWTEKLKADETTEYSRDMKSGQ